MSEKNCKDYLIVMARKDAICRQAGGNALAWFCYGTWLTNMEHSRHMYPEMHIDRHVYIQHSFVCVRTYTKDILYISC